MIVIAFSVNIPESSLAGFAIHPETRLGPVQLKVSDLRRAVRFYTDTPGLRLIHQQDGQASLGAMEGLRC